MAWGILPGLPSKCASSSYPLLMRIYLCHADRPLPASWARPSTSPQDSEWNLPANAFASLAVPSKCSESKCGEAQLSLSYFRTWAISLLFVGSDTNSSLTSFFHFTFVLKSLYLYSSTFPTFIQVDCGRGVNRYRKDFHEEIIVPHDASH